MCLFLNFDTLFDYENERIVFYSNTIIQKINVINKGGSFKAGNFGHIYYTYMWCCMIHWDRIYEYKEVRFSDQLN